MSPPSPGPYPMTKSLSTGARVGHVTSIFGSRDVGAWPYGVTVAQPLVEVRRSKRRTRTVTAYRDGDTLVVLIPGRLSKGEEAHWVTEMQRRLPRGETARRAPSKAPGGTRPAPRAALPARQPAGEAVP